MDCVWIHLHWCIVYGFQCMKSVCLTLNWKQLKHLKKNKFLIALLKKCYVHQLHLHQLHRPRITKNLDGHLLPDGGHISVGPVEGIPVRQQVLNHSQCMGPTVSPAINHVNKHYNGMLLKPIVKENFKYSYGLSCWGTRPASTSIIRNGFSALVYVLSPLRLFRWKLTASSIEGSIHLKHANWIFLWPNRVSCLNGSYTLMCPFCRSTSATTQCWLETLQGIRTCRCFSTVLANLFIIQMDGKSKLHWPCQRRAMAGFPAGWCHIPPEAHHVDSGDPARSNQLGASCSHHPRRFSPSYDMPRSVHRKSTDVSMKKIFEHINVKAKTVLN